MSERHAVRARIRGRVQGVWYRGWTADRARELELHGWVRNRQDGSVEALFVGDQKQIDTMLEACRSGPTLARVDAIDREQAQMPADKGFEIRPTV